MPPVQFEKTNSNFHYPLNSHAPITLTPYPGITSFVSNKPQANAGESVTLACEYDNLDSSKSGDTTVKWYKDGTKLTENIEQASGTKSELRITSVSVNDKGVYKCKVNLRKSFGTKESELTQYVRNISPTTGHKVVAVVGTAVTLSCTVYGDEFSEISWFNSTDTELQSSDDYLIAPGTYSVSEQQQVSKLILHSPTDADDTGEYTCKTTYTEGDVETSTVINLNILGK